jgi:Tol biopolymer transport system component
VWEIALVSVADGSVRVLKSLKRSRLISLSPDGRYVVYARREVEENKGARDIFLLSTGDSGDEVPLIKHPADDYGPVWAPDGKTIVFKSNRSGTHDTWLMQVADGKPAGEPQLVRRNTQRMQPLGFTREGSLYYGLSARSTDVYTVSIDPATGKLLTPPAKAILKFEGFNSRPAWSPDGKSLAYVSVRPSPGALPPRRAVLVIRSVETGQERELYPKADLRNLHWSPDGRSILCGISLQLIDVQSGDVTPILQVRTADALRVGGTWSRDGKAVFYFRVDLAGRTPIERLSIMVYDLTIGKEKELYREGVGIPGLLVSPNGRQLVFIGEDLHTLMIMPTEGGEPRELLRVQEDTEGISGIEWTLDGRYFLFIWAKPDPDQPLRGLWRIPAEGGDPQKLMEMDGLTEISLHPDGRCIAFTGGWRVMEVWKMENFLLESKAGE